MGPRVTSGGEGSDGTDCHHSRRRPGCRGHRACTRFGAANFLRYVAHRAYDGGMFHRTVTLDNQPTMRSRLRSSRPEWILRISSRIPAHPAGAHHDHGHQTSQRRDFNGRAMGPIPRPVISSSASPINPVWILVVPAILMVRDLQPSATWVSGMDVVAAHPAIQSERAGPHPAVKILSIRWVPSS